MVFKKNEELKLFNIHNIKRNQENLNENTFFNVP